MVYIQMHFPDAFSMDEGVGQCCIVKPLVLSLYMNKLEAYIESNTLVHIMAAKKHAIRISGILLPELLFAAHTVFIAI